MREQNSTNIGKTVSREDATFTKKEKSVSLNLALFTTLREKLFKFRFSWLCIIVITTIFLSSCAFITGNQDISLADALFEKKHYSEATDTYRKFLRENPNSLYASDAQYNLAKILITADNSKRDYVQALHEFETFYKLYPKDVRNLEVQNWIAVLKVLNKRSKSIEQLRRLDVRHEERRR